MKPKTILQKKVVAASGKLPEVTEKQKQWAFSRCFEKFVVRSRNTLYCMECGHSWKDKSFLVTKIVGTKCPSCGQELKLFDKYNHQKSAYSYSAIVTTKDNMQVVRMIYLAKHMKKGQRPTFFASEVMQHWITEDGNIVTMSKSTQAFGAYYDSWICNSDLEVRERRTEWSVMRFRIHPDKVHPNGRVLPIFRRNGFKGYYFDIAPHILFRDILIDQHAETLLKTKQIELLRKLSSIRVGAYWSEIKICIRNNYIIKDPSLWKDYIDLLVLFRKDVHNAHYVCPKNLKAAHDQLMRRKERQDLKLKIEAQKSLIEEGQLKYFQDKGRFFDLMFQEGRLKVVPLKSVEEFIQEGTLLNHCVFTNRYYEKKDSLVLSARVEEKPIETIEVSLRDFTIIQSRGVNNGTTELHQDILNVVNKNLHLIKQKAKQAK